MESAKVWLRDNCKMERVQRVAESAGMQKLLSVRAVPYVLLAVAVVALLVKFVNDRQKRPRTWLKGRPRSPDPEKPTDMNTFAEKRMKASERPPGSMWPIEHNAWSLAANHYTQHGHP